MASRQVGKSTAAAALALRTALLAPTLTLLLSPSLRQSCELFRKVAELYSALGRPVPAVQESVTRLELANGSRVVSLPGTEATVRGFSSVALLVVDEAARVAGPLYRGVRPMLATSGGWLVALSTAYAKLGWFFDAWRSSDPWTRVKVPATECPRIAPQFLAEERRALGPRWYGMEYCCEFSDAIDAVFAHSDILASCDDTVEPLFAR